ncbi:DDB1- and CUL4-associated factor 8 [Anthophora retusa]
MDSKDYHKVCEEVDDIEPSTSKDKDSLQNLEDMDLHKTDILKDNEAGINETKMEVEAIEAAHEIQAENEVIQLVESLVSHECDVDNKKNIFEEESKDSLGETSFSILNSTISPQASTSQDNTPTSSNDIESSSLSSDQINGDNVSMVVHGNSSDEDATKPQKSHKSMCNMSTSPTFELQEFESPEVPKLTRKVKERAYRSKRSATGDNGDSGQEGTAEDTEMKPGPVSGNSTSMEVSGNSSDEDESKPQKLYEKKRFCRSKKQPAADNGDNRTEGTAEDTEMRPETEGTATPGGTENREEGLERNRDSPVSDWATTSEEELEEAKEDKPACLKKERPKPNWFVVPELLRREMGINPLFQRRYYGSLHVAEHFELMYKLREHQGCVNALNFNQKGNLLASGSDDLSVVIWDWAIGKKHHAFISGHRSNIFQAKWLPFDAENFMATCARDGQVRLLDIRHGVSRKLATHYAPTHKLAVHPDTPHVIISVGEDAKVLSIDIREEKPTRLLVVREGSSRVRLYTVHSNPLKSNEFCVGGRSQAVRIYDRRKLSTPVCKLCPDHLIENNHAHVTCALYNYNGTEILASYNDEDIYLFDAVSPQPRDFIHRYQGHRNHATVKGVNFFGPKGEFVISGSDCGNLFIWDKNTEAIVDWMPGDEQGIVNCLEPHPHVPILATSGLDVDVKIWVPSCECPPNFRNLENCVRTNAMSRAQETASESDAFDSQMLWILLRHIRHTERVRNLNARRSSSDQNRDDVDDDDDDDDNADDSSDDDSSDHSNSQSEGDGVRTLRCLPS